jgi:hypothetical protein
MHIGSRVASPGPQGDGLPHHAGTLDRSEITAVEREKAVRTYKEQLLCFEPPACAPLRQRSSSGIVFECSSNKVSFDKDTSSRRTDFISALSPDALQDRHVHRQVTASVCEARDFFRKMHKNPFAPRRMTLGNERIPAAWGALARVVNQAIRRIGSCADCYRRESEKHDRDSAVGRFHMRSSVTRIRRIFASHEALTTRRSRLCPRVRARLPGLCFAARFAVSVCVICGSVRDRESNMTV